MPARRYFAIGCAFFLAVVIAFLAGLALAGRLHDRGSATAAPEGGSEFREVFSPVVHNDPNFRSRQRANVEALEAYCRRSGKMCAEARTARKAFDAED